MATVGIHENIMWLVPCDYTRVTSPFGWRIHPVYGTRKFHNGIDMGASQGTHIKATRSGTVNTASYQAGGAGYYVSINHGGGYSSIYMHMTHYIVRSGQYVEQGQVIGYVGSTGASTGPHLHFGISYNGEYVDPAKRIFENQSEIEDLPKDDDETTIIPEDLRISNSELPKDDNWKPITWPSGSSSGALRIALNRRHDLLSNSTFPLFSSYNNHCSICNGYGIFGINSNINSIPSLSKTEVMNAYITTKSDGTKSYAQGGLSGESEKLVANYIYTYLKQEGWSRNAIIALLANIKAESGLNPARWEQDTFWPKYYEWTNDSDFKLSSNPYNMNGSRVYGYDGRPLYSGDVITRGFGLIQWSNWSKFYQKVTDPYDIDTQIEGIISYQNNSYFIHKSSTYTLNILGSNAYINNAQFKKYFDENGKFPISKTDFKNGVINTNVTLSETNKINILTIAYCYNAERPGKINVDTRINNAKHFISMFEEIPEDGVSTLIKPSIDSDAFWNIAESDCGYKDSDKVIKNNLSYCISRVNELLKIFYGDEFGKFIIKREIDNWFEYNKNNLGYDYGNLPRLGSVICWRPTKPNKDYMIGIVENVIGTHCIEISEYKEDDVITTKISNSSHNWGKDSDYKFEGFLYPLHDINIVDKPKEEEDKVNFTNSISTDSENNLVITSYTKDTKEGYSTLLFSISNMKHINEVTIRYEAFIDNSDSSFDGNEFQICLSQQVWNCATVGPLIGDSESNEKLVSEWPFTYFPNKKINEKDEETKLKTDPNRYNAPYPTGNLTLDRISIDNNESEKKEITSKYVLHEYVEDNTHIDAFDNSGDFNRLIRNHPGYLCLTVKSPPLSEKKDGDYTSTTVIIKEILLHG